MKIRSLVAVGLMASAMSAYAVDTTTLTGFTYSPFGGPSVVADIATNFITTVVVTGAAPVPPPAGNYFGGGGFMATFNADSFAAYCVQISVPVGIPGVYTDYAMVNAATGFGDRATDLAKLVTWATANNLPNNAATAAAMQAAVWEIVHETTAGSYSFGAGKVSVSSQSVATQSALTAINWAAIAATNPTMVVSRLDSDNRQDLLIFAPVPETSTLTMMMLGLVGVGVVAQRKLDKKA